MTTGQRRCWPLPRCDPPAPGPFSYPVVLPAITWASVLRYRGTDPRRRAGHQTRLQIIAGFRIALSGVEVQGLSVGIR